ncbi:MAG: hypothetical protein ABEK59_03000 [Halobacteria archaeon]
MVNKDPNEIDSETLPEIDEPVARETLDNMLVGVYRTEDGRYTLQIRDWANRVVEATVYEKDRDDTEEEGGVVFQSLEVPDDMDETAYLNEILDDRMDALKEEEAEAQ